MEKERFIQLRDKYLLGTANEDERTLVEEYYRRLASQEFVSLNAEEEDQLGSRIWSSIHRKIHEEQTPVIKLQSYRNRILKFAVAVSACVLLIVGLNWFFRESAEKQNFVTISVEKGNAIKKVKLADGTLIWIKPNSSVTYPKSFAGLNREIKLAGEALFEVSKDPARPFIVKCNSLDVRVLGTSFNIKDDKKVNLAEVAVLTGKVWVNGPGEKGSGNTLLPFEKLELDKRSGEVRKTGFSSSAAYIQGTEYDLNFVNVPLDSIIRKISTKFNVVINPNNENISQCKISGNFTDQPLTKTIDIICKTIGAQYTIANETVYIKGIKCK